MHVPPWFWFALVTLLCWGGAGLLQKLSTNHISAESFLIWLVVGFLLLEPFFYPGKSIFTYSSVNLAWALLSGVLNALGAWALFAALKSGGKASIVAPHCAVPSGGNSARSFRLEGTYYASSGCGYHLFFDCNCLVVCISSWSRALYF
jgi:transporter family protein